MPELFVTQNSLCTDFHPWSANYNNKIYCAFADSKEKIDFRKDSLIFKLFICAVYIRPTDPKRFSVSRAGGGCLKGVFGGNCNDFLF